MPIHVRRAPTWRRMRSQYCVPAVTNPPRASSQARVKGEKYAAVGCDAVEDVYLAAVGVGIDPDGLSLGVLDNGDAYHFELDQPMHPPVMVASHAARADGDRPPPRREDWHPDQLQLMRQLGTQQCGVSSEEP